VEFDVLEVDELVLMPARGRRDPGGYLPRSKTPFITAVHVGAIVWRRQPFVLARVEFLPR